jgi:hypothetical protein
MMESTRARRLRSLKALASISWLTARQLAKLADSLTVTRHDRRSIIFSDKSFITYNFRCEAVTMCQTGTIGLNNFVKICLGVESAAFKLLAVSFLGHWDRVQLRRSNLIGCTLEERLALTLLDLSENFGVPDRRGGMRLTLQMRHGDLADLVGASRPRVTEHLLEFAQKHLISQQNRHLVVNREGLKGLLMAAQPARFPGEP